MMKRTMIFTFVLMSGMLWGQTKKAYEEAAAKAMIQKNYYAALTYYNEVLDFDAKDVNALVKSAEAARKFNAYDIAAQRYTYLLDTVGYDQDSTLIVYAAEMYQRMGKYDKATEYYNRYISEYGLDDKLTAKAKVGREASVWASSKIKEVDDEIEIKKMEGAINSTYSDVSPVFMDDSIMFTSMRFVEAKNDTYKPARQLSRIMTFGDDKAQPLESEFNKSNLSTANAVFNHDKTKIYYTLCDYITESDLRCDIYTSDVMPNGKYSGERKLPSVINDTAATNTHSFIVKDADSDNETLYFVSDRKGGQGGLDIWYSTYDPKLGFARPINLSSINTAEDEITPFFDTKTKTLYFSSNGKLGLGGFDVYESVYNGGMYSDPIMLSAPINSSYHDIYYKHNEDGTKALLSSNRDGASYVDNLLKACCFDIYEADIQPLVLDLNAMTFDKITGEELQAATVQLIDEDTGEVVAEVTPDDSHEHLFKLDRNKNYLIVGSKPGYIPDSTRLSTINLKNSEPIIKKLYLETDKIILDVFTFNNATKEELAGVEIMIEDLTDPFQNRIIRVNEKGNDFHFDLDKDKTYRITAKKNGFTSVSEIVDTRGVTGKIKKNLYLDPFNLGAYLPIALYFDNDEPNPDSKSTATAARYGDLLGEYMTRKSTFMERYGRGASGSAKQESIENMEEFFEGNVRGGFDQFRIFMDGLIQELQSGKRIDMTVRGYASPRFDLKYNLVLAQRRINSVRNEMERYAGGVLAPYLESKQLIITEISYGEELAPADVSDNINDEKESIYSLRASKQRRVEVISVVSK